MKKLSIVLLILAFAITAYAQFEIQNVNVSSLNGIATLTYDLVATSPCKITVLVSDDGGASYNIYPTALSGDVGDQIPAGYGKQIIWHPSMDGIDEGDNYRVKIIARENPVQSEDQFTSFVEVPGGTFNNGTSNITINSFYIDKYEVTQSEYQAVMGVNPSSFGGNPNRPVEMVNWLNALEYCNRRSLQEGLTPCYTYGSFGSNPVDWPSDFSSSSANHINASCDWSANGYRLPTEMEWMFAARGGNLYQGYQFSGAPIASWTTVLWCAINSLNRTHDVGELAANELGTYDMSGNVMEWCWDIYGSAYPAGDQINPTGPSTGDSRVRRGGSWATSLGTCFVYARESNYPGMPFNYTGLRCVRRFIR